MKLFKKSDSTTNEQDMISWISRIHSLVIGPGLGRSESAFKSVKVKKVNSNLINEPRLFEFKYRKIFTVL